MDFIDQKLSEYCDEHTGAESDLLYQIVRETNLEVIHPRMLSGQLQGRFLSLMSKIQRPKRILEVGTYTGYSALCLAEGLAEGGELVTLEKNKELQKRAEGYFIRSEHADKIKMHIGDAAELIQEQEGYFDLVFIDADKKNYCLYLDLLLPKMSSGALLIADNVLWSGKVVQELDKKDFDTREILAFNKKVNDCSELENVLLPVRDGLMMA